jgi:hypothetical protein
MLENQRYTTTELTITTDYSETGSDKPSLPVFSFKIRK